VYNNAQVDVETHIKTNSEMKADPSLDYKLETEFVSNLEMMYKENNSETKAE
jgi:hypothetical protein